MAPSRLERFVNTLLLTVFIGSLLPLLTILLSLNYAAAVTAEQRAWLIRRRKQKAATKTILITGASTAHGLNVAQAFYKHGYRVVSVGLRINPILNIAKRSRAISKHYDIPNLSQDPDESYVARCLLIVVKQEHPDLWIDCSQEIELETVASARRQIQENTSCVCIAANCDAVQLLKSREALLDFLRNKKLPVPESYTVRSRGEIHNVLNRSQGKKQFLLRSTEQQRLFNPRATLPRRTLSQTYQEVSLVKITPGSQLLLEEYVDASTTYQCSAIVIQGRVELFSARQHTGIPNSSFHDKSALWKAFKIYADAIACELGKAFSSNLTLTFLLNEKVGHAGVDQQILPIEGRLRFDPNFVFPSGVQSINALVLAYTSALKNNEIDTTNSLISKIDRATSSESSMTPGINRQRYFLSTTINELVVRPCLQFLQRKTNFTQVARSILTLTYRILSGDEAYYDFYDPLPAVWQCTVISIWGSIMGAG